MKQYVVMFTADKLPMLDKDEALEILHSMIAIVESDTSTAVLVMEFHAEAAGVRKFTLGDYTKMMNAEQKAKFDELSRT